jgi:hypothetical protein
MDALHEMQSVQMGTLYGCRQTVQHSGIPTLGSGCRGGVGHGQPRHMVGMPATAVSPVWESRWRVACPSPSSEAAGEKLATAEEADRGAKGPRADPRAAPPEAASSMATAVAWPNTARATVNSEKEGLPAISFYFPPPALFLPFHSSLPHPSTPQHLVPHPKSGLNTPQLRHRFSIASNSSSWIPPSVHTSHCSPSSSHAVLPSPFF